MRILLTNKKNSLIEINCVYRKWRYSTKLVNFNVVVAPNSAFFGLVAKLSSRGDKCVEKLYIIVEKHNCIFDNMFL